VKIEDLIVDLLGPDFPLAVRAYDGTALGPPDARATLVIRSKNALRRILTRPGELGFVRAYVAGEVEVEGDIHAFVDLHRRLPEVKLSWRQAWMALRLLGVWNLRPLRPPAEEARIPWGRRHTRAADAVAIAHHYDVSNAFYRLILGPSMTYSCALFESERDSLEEAQANKHELICRKLDLKRGDRLLDIGCGWGSLALHAARYHGVGVVGVTVSQRQVALARERVSEAGLDGLVEIRLQDYRDIDDRPFDAISSVGMFEHVGTERLGEYFAKVYALLKTGGRFLNHAISRRPFQTERLQRAGFPNRYVFPDGELIEIGKVISAIQGAGFEARHMENLREHYARTLRHWVHNLEANWEAVVVASSLGRARVWRLYLAGAASRFEQDWIRVNQVLAVKTALGPGVSGMPLRPVWEGSLRRAPGAPDR
jgi:cyclopropane-fatty-acyl-phospholipid synthase